MSISELLEQTGMNVEALAAASSMDPKRVKAIVAGQYTPSPSDRQRLADALGVAVSEITWGHSIPVEHLRGNGPQSGRST
jgi:ribosome-binding protein aMBF1 (putative translation factor)